jgi:hypothetical protein
MIALVAGSPLLAQDLGPFRTANLNPPVAIFGLPIWSSVPETTTVGASLELANHYRLSHSSSDALLLDGETSRLRAFLEMPVGDRWSWGVDVPVYHQSGGVLDDLVDAWHSAFGLPDGGRNYRAEGMLEFRLANAAGEFFELVNSGSGLGDVQFSVARLIGSGEAWTLRGTLKLPTGREELLAGSGATDVSLSVLRLQQGVFRGRAASYYFGAAWMEIGQPEIVAFANEDRALATILGAALALGQRYGIKGQLDIDSPLYDSALEEIGQTAVQATIGGWFHFRETLSFNFAVSEDLHVSTTPDVVVALGLSALLR